jgi:hypothetical protein
LRRHSLLRFRLIFLLSNYQAFVSLRSFLIIPHSEFRNPQYELVSYQIKFRPVINVVRNVFANDLSSIDFCRSPATDRAMRRVVFLNNATNASGCVCPDYLHQMRMLYEKLRALF